MTDLITQGCQVSLKPFMFTLQSLNTGQVMAIVVSVECLVLLLNPLFSFISIPVEEQTTLFKLYINCRKNVLYKDNAETAVTLIHPSCFEENWFCNSPVISEL